MNKKKIVKNILICLFVLILDFFLGYFYTKFSSSRPVVNFIAGDFYKSEEFYNYKNDYSISKVYYNEEVGNEIVNERKFLLVEDNIQKIQENINISLSNIEQSNENNNLEFNYDIITSNDYYILLKKENNLYLYYYDEDDNILYKFDVIK